MKSTIVNKNKVAIIVAIALIAAIGVSMLAVSCTADTGNGIAPTNATVNAGELEEHADEPELTAVEDRRLHFTARVYDDVTEIATATHERYIVDNERFTRKANSKLTAQS